MVGPRQCEISQDGVAGSELDDWSRPACASRTIEFVDCANMKRRTLTRDHGFGMFGVE
jgi:hypothetical protein